VVSPSIHAAASRKGKAVEHLIAAFCILGSDGELNAWTSLVDDEGVDLVLQRRARPETISVQIKARLTTAKGLAIRQSFQTQVKDSTFRPRSDLYMLFVVANPRLLDIGPLWLIPSFDFAECSPLDAKNRHRFRASAKEGSNDRWADYLVPKAELPSRLLGALAQPS
jgi:hypothetical protein